MELYFKRSLIGAILLAVVTTALGYLVDDDPPYPNVFHTLAESTVIVVVLFALYLLLILGFRALAMKLQRVFR